uniref:G-protein coupled receptors family 1 profile domain-containing protein n=1 Tax=Neolamprologus brichardi TaxID=32507 RepID=A0A3Q4NBY9_NEOBR
CSLSRTSATMKKTHILFILSVSLQVGLLLNGFILKFYFHQVRQQTSSSLMVYLKNLTAADFLLCLSLPFDFCIFGTTVTFLVKFFYHIFSSLCRYLKIVHPSGTHVLQTVRTAHIVSTVTWAFLLAQTITYNIMFFITHKPLTSDRCYCGPLFSTSFSVLHKTFQISCTIIFLLVSIFLVFFYYSTSRRVLQAQQRQLASSEKLVKSRRNMLVLVSIFCVCFVPYHLVRVPYSFFWNNSVGGVLYYLKEAATMVSVFNVCLDPLVYFYLCKTFRAQVRKMSRRVNDPGKRRGESITSNKESHYLFNVSHYNGLTVFTLHMRANW